MKSKFGVVMDLSQQLSSLVRPALQYGLSATKAHLANKAHVIGDILLILGVVSFFFYQIFPEAGHDNDWYYGNWYYYFFSVRVFLIFIFWGSANYLYSNSKTYRFANYLILCSGIVGFAHYSFFVTDDVTYHELPLWWVILFGVAAGFGFIQSLKQLVYIWEHKKKGNHARFVGVAEQDMPEELRDTFLKSLAKEYRELNKHY